MVWVLMEGEVERIMKEMGEGKLIRTYFFKSLFSIRENKIIFLTLLFLHLLAKRCFNLSTDICQIYFLCILAI